MMAEHAAPDEDPHAELHELAGGEPVQHDPAPAGDGSWQEELAKLNKELTKRINDLRTDTDTFKKATSKTVSSFQTDIGDLKTATANNKDAIAAQDQLIDLAATKADAAKKAADMLDAEYRTHTHPLQISMSGHTDPPGATTTTSATQPPADALPHPAGTAGKGRR